MDSDTTLGRAALRYTALQISPPGQWAVGEVTPTPYLSLLPPHLLLQPLGPPGVAAPGGGGGGASVREEPTPLPSLPPRSFWDPEGPSMPEGHPLAKVG